MLINMLWMTFDKVFILILNLFVTLKIANFYGALEYGKYQYAIGIVALLEIFVNYVDARVVKKRYIEYDNNNLVFNVTVLRALFSIISAFFGLIFLFFSQCDFQFSVMFFTLLLNMIVINLRFGICNRFEYLLKSKKIVLAADISALISCIFQLVAIYYKSTIIVISIIALISSVINLFIIFIQYRIEFGKPKNLYIDSNLVKDILHESFPLALATSCYVIYERFGLISIGNILSPYEVGVFSISAKLVSVAQIIISPIRESVYPKLIELYKEDISKYEHYYIHISCILTWIYFIGLIFSFIILPYIFNYLNKEYIKALDIYKIHIISVFFMYNSALRAGHYTLINKGYILTYSQFFCVIINIILNLYLIRLYGIYGASISTIMTQFFSLSLSNLFFGKIGKQVFVWQCKALIPSYIIYKKNN